jgi:hypothetical protein
MLPSLKVIRSGLAETTEALASDLGRGAWQRTAPDWNPLQWKLATAAAAAHGVGALLAETSAWRNPHWQEFLRQQREHVADRHRRIAALLEELDRAARAIRLAIVPLKGSALHALGLYQAGERPMADVDLLVRDGDVEEVRTLLASLGYVETYKSWKHHVFEPRARRTVRGLGEHRDIQITIELHTRIQERLPVSTVDITSRVYPRDPQPGLNSYPSTGALMSHLLLHTAGNIRCRSLRLLHLNDIARLAARMSNADWDVLWGDSARDCAWWALPPLRMTARYFRGAVPESVLQRLESACPALLRRIARRQSLTQTSCSGLWVQALPGIEWSRSLPEVGRFLRQRFVPDQEAVQERAAVLRKHPWMQAPGWGRAVRWRTMLLRLARPVPRTDTLYVVRAALEDAG